MTSVESDFFWLCATVQLVVSLRFVSLVRQFRGAKVTATLTKLANGQRQDSWLASGIVWGMILCRGMPYSNALFDAGSVALAWLIVRSCNRISLVKGAR